MKKIFTILAVFYSFFLLAQPNLKPSIGIGALPNDSDPICSFPVFTGDFNTSGYAIGDTIPDFTLYTAAGIPVNAQNLLAQGKPILLIGGNLTCPVFRNKIATINSMASIYAGLLDIYIIYGIEAHPTTPSPYSGAIWTTSSNQQANILHPQPTTYGERKDLLDTLLALTTINVPILVDGPCNEWVSNFGPAPNNAYLIDTNGVIYEKQGWYHKLPDDMYCEIDSMLGTNSGQCNLAGNNGNFSFSYVYDTIEYGAAGDVLGVHARLTNNSTTDNAVVEIFRAQVYTPSTWLTAMCVDICLPTTTDTTQVVIPPSATQDFIFYFYTDPAVDSVGWARLGFRNVNVNPNKFFKRFWGETGKNLAISSIETEENFVQIYPNPSADGIIFLDFETPFEGAIQVFDLHGKVVKDFGLQSWDSAISLDLSNLATGMYVLNFSNGILQKNVKVVRR